MASKPINVHHDFGGANQIKNVLLDVRSSDPGAPAEGQFWYNSTTHVMKYQDNSTVQTLGTNAGLANAYNSISDGSVTATASGGDTIKFRATGSGLSVAVQNNDATNGDNVLYTLNSGLTGNSVLVLTTAGGKITASLLQEVIAIADLSDVSGKTGTGSTVVMDTSPTIVTPTIASFTNSAHNHTNAAGGGTLTHSAISDFDTQVRTSSLSQMLAPTGDLSIGGFKLTGVATPTTGTDAANKNYVDNTVQGLQTKATATVATVAALPTNTYANGTSGVGATITANANAALTVDSYAVAVNDLVLVKNEVASANNGLYVVTQIGSGAAPFILTRHTDMDTVAEFSGAFIPVGPSGTTASQKNSLWLANPSGVVVVGTTAIPFTQLNGATDLVQSTGISISGNTISIDSAYVGQATITTLGTIATGTWSATAIAVNKGGTGQTTAATARGTSGIGAATAPTVATNVTVAAGGIGTMVVATMTGTGAATSFTITHNLNNSSPIVGGLINASSGAIEDVAIVVTDANTVTVTFNTAPTNGLVYRLNVCG